MWRAKVKNKYSKNAEYFINYSFNNEYSLKNANKSKKAALWRLQNGKYAKKKRPLTAKQEAFSSAAKGHFSEFLLSNINCIPLFL